MAETKKWAKLFEVQGQQVLFFLEPDGDDMRLHQCVQRPDGIHMDMTLVFTNDVKDNSRTAFDMIDQAGAECVFNLMHDTLSEAVEDA